MPKVINANRGYAIYFAQSSPERMKWTTAALQILADAQEQSGERCMEKILDENEGDFRARARFNGAPPEEVDEFIQLLRDSFEEARDG